MTLNNQQNIHLTNYAMPLCHIILVVLAIIGNVINQVTPLLLLSIFAVKASQRVFLYILGEKGVFLKTLAVLYSQISTK